MTERQFIEQNKSDWQKLEEIIGSEQRDPEVLHKLFVKVSGDLAYAQTFYPRRSIRWYLNSLVSSIFDTMRTKEKRNIFHLLFNFYSKYLPSVIIKHRSAFLLSIVVFCLSLSIGIHSTLVDKEFPNAILGDYYIFITEQNIAKGDPMAIYKSDTEINSFFRITLNNILVALRTYAMGLFAAIGTFFILIYNGIMVGTFQTFFYNKSLLATSMLSIWIHGTIEISSIIIAGAAGLVLGKSILFPKTFTRLQSLRIGAVESMYILVSTLPLFVFAGFFEGFVTRQTELPVAVKGGIIFLSLVFILTIYLFRPLWYYRKGLYQSELVKLSGTTLKSEEAFHEKNSLKQGLHFINLRLGDIVQFVLLPISVFFILSFYWLVGFQEDVIIDPEQIDFSLNFHTGGFYFGLILMMVYLYLFTALHCLFQFNIFNIQTLWQSLKSNFVGLFLFAMIFTGISLLHNEDFLPIIIFAFLPWATLLIFLSEKNSNRKQTVHWMNSIANGFKFWSSTLGTSVLFTVAFIPIYLSYEALMKAVGKEILSWHPIYSNDILKEVYLESVFYQLLFFLYFIVFVVITRFSYAKVKNNKTSEDLYEGLENFGIQRSLR